MASMEFFEANKLQAFIKTSGKTGMHIYIPCSDFLSEQARSIAEIISTEIHSLVKSITTTEASISLRGNKLYIDPNQNDYADTVVAPYCVRPFHQPLVSAPLEWKELKPALDQMAFNINTISKRLSKKGDLFAAVPDQKIAAANSAILSKKFL
jgi:bifunctional non-homologous end joining protein LigD